MGGAMQLTFRKMAFDYYPFHWAGRRILNEGSSSMAQVLRADFWVHLLLPSRKIQGIAVHEVLEITLFKTLYFGNFQDPLLIIHQ